MIKADDTPMIVLDTAIYLIRSEHTEFWLSCGFTLGFAPRIIGMNKANYNAAIIMQDEAVTVQFLIGTEVWSENFGHDQLEKVIDTINQFTRAHGMQLTPQQARTYSREWREVMDSWQSRGYNVTWERGWYRSWLVIWSKEVEIGVRYIPQIGKWQIMRYVEDQSLPFDAPQEKLMEHDTKAISLVNEWLEIAEMQT